MHKGNFIKKNQSLTYLRTILMFLTSQKGTVPLEMTKNEKNRGEIVKKKNVIPFKWPDFESWRDESTHCLCFLLITLRATFISDDLVFLIPSAGLGPNLEGAVMRPCDLQDQETGVALRILRSSISLLCRNQLLAPPVQTSHP